MFLPDNLPVSFPTPGEGPDRSSGDIQRLRVARGCPAAVELLAELAAFHRRRDGRGRVRVEARGPEHHSDLAIAVALALFAQALARAAS